MACGADDALSELGSSVSDPLDYGANFPLLVECACAGIITGSSSSTRERKQVTFDSAEAQKFHYLHLTHFAGGEMAYWSWKNIGDRDRPFL